jgi:flagellin
MGFRINTNVAAMTAHNSGVINNRNLDGSLSRLSSGLRINTAADDASGMAIADSLRSQANSLGQAVKNANDAIGVIQTADKAMDEQIKIVDTIKTKAVQAAQDGQSTQSRQALQSDITRLMEELDNIATTTSFNGMKLLSGSFTNREFQIGAFSNETVKASIGATNSDKIGAIRYETTATISSSGMTQLSFVNPNGTTTTLQNVSVSHSAGTGLSQVAEAINKAADILGVRASYRVVSTGSASIQAGNIRNLQINGVTIGDIMDLKASDSKGTLINSINAVTAETGVYASIDIMGRITMTSMDGRGININAGSAGGSYGSPALLGIKMTAAGAKKLHNENYGRLTLVGLSSRDIIVSSKSANMLYRTGGNVTGSVLSYSAATLNLRDLGSNFTAAQGLAAGAYAGKAESASASRFMGAGVTTRVGAMMVMDMADSARQLLDKIRADLGSVQNQLVSTINNITVTEVSVKSAESQIRDVDFAEESANFSKNNILIQSGSFAMAQANQVQQNVLKLLQ